MLDHVGRMAEDNIVQRMKRWKPCLKDQLEDLKHVGKMTFRRYKEHECTQLEESNRIETVGGKSLNKPQL